MNHSIRMAAITTLVAVSALALPTAAQADPIDYMRSAEGTLVSTISAHSAAPVAVGATTGSGTDRSLPAAGIDNAMLLGLWVGGGALVLAGGVVAVAAAVRRNRKEHAGV